ncbi:carboxypeptidase-like regulatory domain-containing protein [Paraflavitalea speifideaquila]|uniref:carboxypeptidase-like regulatory domain-containing protein n=1 Tax=Paraflavitalea speifideaquila TaxID=3076558 RepID=UPI0028E55438|nr:carboxypeptidase-like regulatory domain-containing protein [Paraflavitalea speifideiaquila]
MKLLKLTMLPVLLTAVAVLAGMGAAFAQTEIKGVVTDPGNQPLSGVSVIVKGSASGTSTDLQGRFTINAPANGTLVFSRVGYASQEVLLKGQSSIDLQLQQGKEALDEVVVTALGIKKKKGGWLRCARGKRQ